MIYYDIQSTSIVLYTVSMMDTFEFEDVSTIEEMLAADPVEWYMDEVQEESDPAIPDDSEFFAPVGSNEQLRRIIENSNRHWMQIPIPVEYAPCGGAPFAAYSDDEIMAIPPALLVHVLQTASNGGLQIIAPQQIPLGDTILRTAEKRHTKDMMLVGSVASRNMDWPVVSSPVPAHLFPDTPIDGGAIAVAVRKKTKTIPLAPRTEDTDDPVVKAFIQARALIDLQARTDVGGDPRSMAEIMANAWGVSANQILDLPSVSLAPTGELLRYAARADQVTPRIYSTLNTLLCISSAAHTTGRLVYGRHAAVDWRRARVASEAAFLMSMKSEGYSLLDMRLDERPGDPRASPIRAGIFQTRPRPGCVWSCAPETFRLTPKIGPATERDGVIIPRVMEALVRYDEEARPVAMARTGGTGMSHAVTTRLSLTDDTYESLITGYVMGVEGHAAGMVRGKTAQRTVRSVMYNSLSGMPTTAKIRLLELARAFTDATAEAGLTKLWDAYRHMANCFGSICSEVRSTIAAEAIVRHTTLDDWWSDFASALPKELQQQKEGTAAWGAGMFWMLCNPPEPKWRSLQTAMAVAQMTQLTTISVPEQYLPIVRRSVGRVTAAMHSRCSAVSHAFSERYAAMTHLAMIMGDEAESRKKMAWKRRLRVAGAMWDLRAEVARTMTLVPIDPAVELHVRGIVVVGGTFYRLTCNPYKAYNNLRSCIKADTSIPAEVRSRFPSHVATEVSQVFRGMGTFSTDIKYQSRLMRYYSDPARLGEDIEATLRAAHVDILETVELYTAEGAVPVEPTEGVDATVFDGSRLMEMMRPKERIEGKLTYLQAIEAIEDQTLREEIDDWVLMCEDAAHLDSTIFTSGEDLIEQVRVLRTEVEERVGRVVEAVT